VDAALDDMERAGKPADLVSNFALPVPSLVISELLGVPYADHAEFQDRSDRLVDISLPEEQRIAHGGRTARTWRAWSPAPRPTPARTCWGC
jgi:cytochrome P450